MNRRQFLQSTAAALAVTALPLPRLSAATPTVGLGFTLYGMPTLPISEALKVCSETGYDNVELALNPGYPTETSKLDAGARKLLRQQLADNRLTVSGLMENLSLLADDKTLPGHLERLKAAAQLAHDLKQKHQPPIETVLGGKPAEWDKVKDRMADRLGQWAKVAEEGKAVVAIKAHVMSAVNSPERLLWLLDQVKSPAIQAAYDFSHFEVEGMDMAETMKALLPRTRFIHVKDTAGDEKKFQFLLPGQGRTDYVKYFTLLKQFGYHGPVVVEVSAQVFKKPGYDPVAAAKSSFAALSAARQKAGLAG